MKYHKPASGEWIIPARRNHYRLACCDCGLVHDVQLRIVRNAVQFRVFLAPRSTAMIRRHMGLRKRADGTYYATATVKT